MVRFRHWDRHNGGLIELIEDTSCGIDSARGLREKLKRKVWCDVEKRGWGMLEVVFYPWAHGGVGRGMDDVTLLHRAASNGSGARLLTMVPKYSQAGDQRTELYTAL